MAMGNPVDTAIAKKAAMNFMMRKANVSEMQRGSEAELALVVRKYSTMSLDTMNYFYIYNVGNNYVIVSADDRLEPIVCCFSIVLLPDASIAI